MLKYFLHLENYDLTFISQYDKIEYTGDYDNNNVIHKTELVNQHSIYQMVTHPFLDPKKPTSARN